jgi:hypothetical protein
MGALLLAGCSTPALESTDQGSEEQAVFGIIGFSAADATLNKTAEDLLS